MLHRRNLLLAGVSLGALAAIAGRRYAAADSTHWYGKAAQRP